MSKILNISERRQFLTSGQENLTFQSSRRPEGGLASISLDRGRRANARAHAAAALAVHREAGHVPGQSRAGRLLELLAET
jgi:hypothetical protein